LLPRRSFAFFHFVVDLTILVAKASFVLLLRLRFACVSSTIFFFFFFFFFPPSLFPLAIGVIGNRTGEMGANASKIRERYVEFWKRLGLDARFVQTNTVQRFV
jgi:hypothetical protein